MNPFILEHIKALEPTGVLMIWIFVGVVGILRAGAVI